MRRPRPTTRRAALGIALAGLVGGAGWSRGPAMAQGLLGEDPIFAAIQNGDREALNRELLGGAYVNGRDDSQRTPLIAAVQAGRPAMVDLLIAAGALVNDADATGNSALAWAAKEGEVAMLDRLLAAGANIDPPNRQGMTPLMLAAREGEFGTAERLVQAGADPNLLDYTGRSARDWAAESRNSRLERLLSN